MNDQTADLAGVTPLALSGARLATHEAYIAAKLAQFGIPGASVAVVQGGEVVFLQGFGVRELERSAPVTADTMLRIGSVTKSLSSLLAATLVDDGRLTWEAPIVDLLPDFAVADSDLTPLLTIADSFSAATGLPRRDWEFIFNGHAYTPDLVLASIAQLPLTAPYGTTYQYSNQMVAAGGWAAAMAAGGTPNNLALAYKTALRERILHPIGMIDSTFDIDDAVAGNNYAAAHAADITGALRSVSQLTDETWIVPVAPSGGLWSNARDMARYVQTQLNRGVSPDGGRIVSEANLERTWEPGVAIGESGGHYGLGWAIKDHHGQPMVFHAGATLGAHSLVTLLPESGLGVVVLTNATVAIASPFTLSVVNHLFELLFDQPAVFDDQVAIGIAAAAEERADLLTRLREVDPAAVTPYLGRYTNPDLGEAILTLPDGKLEYAAGGHRSELLALADADGALEGYVFIDPSITYVPPVVTVTFEEDADGGPRMMLKIADEPGTPDLFYPFAPIGTV